MLTSCCLAFSAGGKYGGSGALRRNAEASVEKYNMMLPTISRRSFVTGMMNSRRTLYTKKKTAPINNTPHIVLSTQAFYLTVYLSGPCWVGSNWWARGSNVPFLAGGNAPHTMQLIQYRLQACQNRTIKLDRKRALQAWLMLRLLEQTLQFKKLDLQMQLPIYHVSLRLPQNGAAAVDIHRHKLFNRVVQPPWK